MSASAKAARRAERRWRWPTMAVLLATIPAFYAELLLAEPSLAARLAYVAAALVLAIALFDTGRRTGELRRHVGENLLDVILVAGLLATTLLPASSASPPALATRLAVALLTLVRMVWTLQHHVTRGGLIYLSAVAVGVLALSGIGFWWLEPNTPTLPEGMWLAFTTAATVGYGDVVPSTPASKIFAIFVVMLGYGVITIAAAAIASHWVESEERRIEREILADLHRQVHALREEIAALRAPTEPTAPADATGSAEDPRRSANPPS